MYVTEIAQAPLLILFKASLKQQADGGWCSVRQGVPVRLTSKDGRDGVGHRAAPERGAAGEHFVQDASECPDVATFVDDLTPRLFGAHVSGRAQDRACAGLVRSHRRRVRQVGRRRRPRDFRQAKVEDLRHTLGRDLDVGGLQVAVNDPFFVSDIETDGDLARDAQRFANGQAGTASALPRHIRELVRECLAVHELENEKSKAVSFLEAVDRADVRMIQRGEHSRLALEA
jgi:hypothetical protein